MKKIKWSLSIGFANASHEGILEFEDKATEEEIQESVEEFANGYIDLWWKEVKE